MSEAPDANYMLKVCLHATFDVAVEVEFWFQVVMLQHSHKETPMHKIFILDTFNVC